MKKNIFILLVGLLSCQLTVFAQEPSVKTIDVEIKSDTTIVVRDLFGEDCKLYGDIILIGSDMNKVLASENGENQVARTFTKYGGDSDDTFNSRMQIANGNKEYKKYVSRNENGIVIKLLYNELPDTILDLKFYGVLFDGVLKEKKNSKNETYWGANEWYRDLNNIYCISIIKQKQIAAINDGAESKVKDIESSVSGEAGELLASDVDSDGLNSNKPTNEFQKLERSILLILLLLIISLFIVVFVRINKLNKGINTLLKNPQQSPLKSETINIETIKQTVISKIQSKDLAQRISNEDIYNVINRSDIQLYIQTVIAGKVDEYLRNNKITNPVPAGISSGSNQQSPVVQPELRTTKVEYRADNNCFVVSENSQNKIFEIYSINGEYYYTIVNDSSIRKEMLGFITAFSGYVETRQSSPIPSTVEVIRDGRLIKNGDMYIVDTNCILQVSLM